MKSLCMADFGNDLCDLAPPICAELMKGGIDYFYVGGNGGDTESAEAIIAMMGLNPELSTIAVGGVYSAHTHIFLSAKRRYIARGAFVGIHRPGFERAGRPSASDKRCLRLTQEHYENTLINALVSAGKSRLFADLFASRVMKSTKMSVLSAEEAVEAGLAHGIFLV